MTEYMVRTFVVLFALLMTACPGGGGSKGDVDDATAEGSDTTQPDTTLDTTQPDGTEPDTTLDTNQPDTAQPDTAQPDTNQPDTNQPDTNINPDVDQQCSRDGFDVARGGAYYEGAVGNSIMQYSALSSIDIPFDNMRVQVYQTEAWQGPDHPDTYSLDGINYRDCGLCLLIFANCTESECEKTFYAEQGSVEITAIGELGDDFAGTLHDVVFQEVTIDDTYWSTPVPNGETWCVDGLSFSEEIMDPAGASCEEPNVNCVGETIPDFSLQSCDTEEMVSMSSLAENQKALWVILTAGWCPACHDWLGGEVTTRYNANAANGLDLVVVLGENASENQPTIAYCRTYAQQYNIDISKFYIDHDGTYSYATTFTYMWPYVDSTGMFGLPWNALINATTMEYAYADGGPSADLFGILGTLLAQ